MTKIRTLAAAGLFTALAVLLTGCGTGIATSTGGSTSTATTTSPTLRGSVYGGQQGVSGATIQLYAVGITGLKSQATPLIGSLVQTQADGSFTISGDWNCTSNTAAYGANPLLYIVATGGNPGFVGTVNNPALAMMSALGPCSGLTATSSIFINEVTTVASVVALAPFMADIAHVGAQGAGATGLANAFATANVLANMSTGVSPGTLAPNVTVPSAEIYTLADILSICVNSTGLDSQCSAIFALAPGVATPTNTIAAMLNIYANPAANVHNLFQISGMSPPFVPTLIIQPNDWTVALNITGGGLSAPAGLALDASGNVWVANAAGNSITELSSTGAPLTGAAGYTANNTILGAQGIAVDKSGNVWVADTLLSSVVELTVSGGVVQSSSSFTAGGIDGPIGIAIDSQNNVWVANFAGASVTELNSAGVPLGSSPLTAGGTLHAPFGIAIDYAGNAWLTDNQASAVVEFNTSQSLLSGAGYTDSGILAPEGIAIDTSGRAWIAYQGTNSVGAFSSGGQPVVTAPYTGGGLSMPTAVAVDGQGTVWVANGQTAGSISRLTLNQSAPLSPASGYGVLNAPFGIAIDASGSLWTANTGDNSVSKLVGIAAPVAMPLAASVGP